jgi:hypothetical protein
MTKKSKVFALYIAIAVILAGAVFTIAAVPAADNSLALDPALSCADLRMDEFYACEYGGWQPTPEAVNTETAIGPGCGDLPTDQYYACVASGWKPDSNEPVLSR